MLRFTKPLPYLLVFSLTACASTAGIDVSNLESGVEVGGLVWVETRDGGDTLVLRDAVLTDDALVGIGQDGESVSLPLASVAAVRPVGKNGWAAPVSIMVIGGLLVFGFFHGYSGPFG